ncbi:MULTISPECIES: GMC family oxidoreductase [Microbacterium]|uniref:GMC family oxidoreductase n=1 Tax=Microbacterium TaxID=33882 RepID=UPI00103F8C36|nr:GMC family oxidoreductase N-terminal domain-containing protein [Microbacterium sp. PI-1]TCJ21565.1 dehydrogenase [Microbacterium sp. PI-1]
MIDVIIVGGGTAGCVLARRLSENPERSVLLLEAGPDYSTPETTPVEILDAKLPPMSHDWGYVAADQSTPERPVFLPRGKLIGGSSATNYAFAMRARPADHDEWAERGLTGWGWEDVLPLYKEMETDLGGDATWHGTDGPFRVTRPGWDEVAPTARAFAEACRALSIPVVDDVNAPTAPGFGIVPRNQADGVRESLALTYLNPVRERPNLQIRGRTLVDRVLLEGDRAVGVVLSSGEELRAGHVILAAGAFNSPAILMRSGIGAADDLTEHGIAVRHELPGVGRNLMEHPVFWNIYAAKPSDAKVDTIFQSCLSYRIRDEERDYDLHLIPSSLLPAEDVPPQYVPPAADHPTGFDFVIFVSNMRPRSRGRVRLADADPNTAPQIELNLYGDPADAEIVAEGVRLARRLAQQTPLADYLVEERAPGATVEDADLVDAVQRAVTHYNHPSGTCRMGVPGDPGAVVDVAGRVHGLHGLSVIDASIIPVLPRVAINPTTVLIAEKLAKAFDAAS